MPKSGNKIHRDQRAVVAQLTEVTDKQHRRIRVVEAERDTAVGERDVAMVEKRDAEATAAAARVGRIEAVRQLELVEAERDDLQTRLDELEDSIGGQL